MSLPDTRSANRLGAWLKDQLSVNGLVASSPAPVWSIDELPDELQDRLSRLDHHLRGEELSFAPALRYAKAAEPSALRLLRRHEGLAPGAPAVLRPESAAHLEALTASTQNNGLKVASEAAIFPDVSALPVDLDGMKAVDVLSAPDGLVRFQAGASWDDLSVTAAEHGLAVPDKLTETYASPACAARSGFLKCSSTLDTRGIAAAYDVTLPPQGTKWLERLWLFRNEKKARRACELTCRNDQAVFAELIPAPRLQIAHQAGLLRLPRRYFQQPDYTAVRLVFEGPLLAALCAEFAASWPLESANSFQWNNRPIPSDQQITNRLLEAGATVVSICTRTTFLSLPSLRQNVVDAMKNAALECSPASPFVPLIMDAATFAGGELTLSITLVAPRDYLTPLTQWQAIYAAGLAAIDGLPLAAPEASPHLTEESPEWQAIRDALLDEQGKLRPAPADGVVAPLAPARNHG